jgi:hypothetical protein
MRNGGTMNDIDQELRGQLRRLIDPQPVDTDRALREIEAERPRHRAPAGLGVLAAAAVAAGVIAVAVIAPTSGRQAPPYKLVGAAGAAVVVRIDSTGDQPTAELTVGDTTVQGKEVAGTPVPNGISLDEPFDPISQPAVDVPGGSSLRVEGRFDTASASVVPWLAMTNGSDGAPAAIWIGTWELDSSGGSVVFPDAHDSPILVVDATVGGLHHYFFFHAHVVPVGG